MFTYENLNSPFFDKVEIYCYNTTRDEDIETNEKKRIMIIYNNN